MIPNPISTVEMPLTAIDYIAALEYCETLDEVRIYGDTRVPMDVRQDDRFARAVQRRLAAITDKRKRA